MVWALVLHELNHAIAGRFAEDHQIQQRVGSQPVSAMHRSASALARRIKAIDPLFRIARAGRDDFAFVIGRNPAHLVVAGRHNRNRLLDRINAGELDRDFANTGQAMVDDFRPEVIELE